MDKFRQVEIEKKALEVLEANKITDPVVDVIKIAESQNIKIKEVKMPPDYTQVAGFYDSGEKIIYINKEDAPERKLFSIAHELGHIFLGHKHSIVLFRVTIMGEEKDYPVSEKEANSFAAHLLMPDFMLRNYMNKYNLGKNDYKILAGVFGVPPSSMKYTLMYMD